MAGHPRRYGRGIHLKHYLQNYADILHSVSRNLDPSQFGKMVDILAKAYREDRQVFIAGNGGSAGTANHFACDFSKNAVQEAGKRRFRLLSLSDNIEKITALANDIAYEEVFAFQLENLWREGDVLIVVSASGNSPNIVRACEFARARQAPIIGLVGFDGGKVRDLADALMLVPLRSYEQVEDVHLIILHMLVCYFKDHPELLETA